MNGASTWLNQTFSGFDSTISGAIHQMSIWGGKFFTPFFVFLGYIGQMAIVFFLLAAILMILGKTRKAGLIAFLALLFGALLTNAILKNVIARPRPFTDETSVYYQYWYDVGMNEESGYSFPSGHATASMAFATALFLYYPKKTSWLAFFIPLIMSVSRIYLMVHYPSDILAGLIVGGLSGVAAYYLMKFGFRHVKFCHILDVPLEMKKLKLPKTAV